MNIEQYKKCMAKFTTGIAVITCQTTPNHYLGITINSLTSVSLKPLLILFTLHNESSKLPFFNIKSEFVINILSAEQKELVGIFAKKQENFPITEFFLHQNIPVFHKSLAFLHCAVTQLIPGGDHQIIIGQVNHHQILHNKKPLIYFDSNFLNNH